MFFYETCVRVGLLALPLCGAAPTFFAAAKKVGKESSSSHPKYFTPAAAQANCLWHGSSKYPQRSKRAWIGHGLTS
ncbi:hypothetical protein AWB71_03394 [Caballeronia peredens]|nr:hypothetical protein AWB71_03394 [Caballeronia peredens]